MKNVKEAPTGGAKDVRAARAARIIEELTLLSSDKIDQAFAAGRLLLEWEEGGYFEVAGHETQEAVIAATGMKRSTALSNKRLAAKFDLEQVRHLGVGKLRLLAANYLDAPLAVVYDGIEIADGEGGTKFVMVEDLSYRELQGVLAAMRKAKGGRAPRKGDPEGLRHAIEEAAAPLLATVAPKEAMPLVEMAA